MIYTVTINPALDYHMEIESPVFGEINRSAAEEVYPGGKGLNVSVVLSRLGIENLATGFIGGFVGEVILHSAQELGIRCDFVPVEGESRINLKLHSRQETAFNGAGPQITTEDMERLIDKLSCIGPDDYLVLSGNVQEQFSNCYALILDRLAASGCRVVVDAAGDTLWNAMRYRPYLVKPNLEELGELFDFPEPSYDEAVSMAAHLLREGAQNVLVSMGSEGAFLLTEGERLLTANAVLGPVISTVGAGDALAAGFLAGLLFCGNKVQALAMGVAAGCAATRTSHLPQKQEIMSLLSRVQVMQPEG